MALLNTINHMKIRFKTISGYIKYMLTSDSIIMKNGKDLQTEINTINTDLAFHIVDQGSNINGFYRKFSDGTVEIWGRLKIISNGAATITNYPCNIIEPPIMWATVQYSSYYPAFSLSVQPLDGRTNIYVRDSSGRIPTSEVNAFWHGISRWR